jgi:hypothetical protein
MTEIDLANLIEQHTGLTDRHSPEYARAYRLAHAVMTATAEKSDARPQRNIFAEINEGFDELEADRKRRATRKDLPSPAPEDDQ